MTKLPDTSTIVVKTELDKMKEIAGSVDALGVLAQKISGTLHSHHFIVPVGMLYPLIIEFLGRVSFAMEESAKYNSSIGGKNVGLQ